MCQNKTETEEWPFEHTLFHNKTQTKMGIKRRHRTTAEMSKKFRDCSGVFSFQAADQINFVCIRFVCTRPPLYVWLESVFGDDDRHRRCRLLRSVLGIALLLRWNFSVVSIRRTKWIANECETMIAIAECALHTADFHVDKFAAHRHSITIASCSNRRICNLSNFTHSSSLSPRLPRALSFSIVIFTICYRTQYFVALAGRKVRG